MALLKNIAEARQYLKLPKSNSSAFLPSSDATETDHIVPILGEALYATLVTAYEAGTLTTIQEHLLAKCHAVIVPLAYIRDIPLHQASINDTGLASLLPEGQQKVYGWEYKKLEDELYMRGYAAQEQLILFLKANAASFTDWGSSPYNNPDSIAIIRDGSELRDVLSLQMPHRCYLLLKPIMQRLVNEMLIPAWGTDYYTALNARIIGNTTSSDEKKILPSLRAAIAMKAMQKAATELNLQFGAQGFTIVDMVRDADNSRKGAGEQRIERFRAEMEQGARIHFEQVMEYMNANASISVFPEFFNSPYYKDPAADTAPPIDNGGRKGVFVLGR